MKKITRLMILMLVNIFLVIMSPVVVNGASEETSDNTEIEKNLDENIKSEVDNLYDYINKRKTDVELMNGLDPVEYIKSYIKDGKGNLEFSKVGKAVVSLLFKEVSSVLTIAISLIAIAILCSFLKNLQDAFSSKGLSQIAFMLVT